MTVSIEDADSDVYQVSAGSLPADGRDHALTASLGSAAAIYPLRLASISLRYTLPARKARRPGGFTLDRVSGAAGPPVPGTALRGWPAVASSAELRASGSSPARPARPPCRPSRRPPPASRAPAALAVTFSPGYGLAAGGTPGTVSGS